MTDTPIYDQIRQELEAGTGRAEPLGRRSSSRAQDDSANKVSVWSLVAQNRAGRGK